MRKNNSIKILSIVIALIFFILAVAPAIEANDSSILERKRVQKPCRQDYPLPPPMDIDMILEESMMRRMSIREYTDEPVTDEELSTILWAAYGVIDDERQTISPIEGDLGATIYIVKEDAVYTYNPINHSLVLYKEGEYLDIVGWQYPAPMVLGLVWNSTHNEDEYIGSAQLGEIGQNVYFTANAINLGCVVTGTLPTCPMEQVGLPDGERGRYVIYLGHPAYDYNFINRPMLISLLPRVKHSEMSVSTVIEERSDATSWQDDSLTRKEQTQMLWSSYGFSYYIDRSEPGINFFNITRHRTVPSGCAIYPFHIYAVTESKIYRYYPGIFDIIYDSRFNGLWWLPVISFNKKIVSGDHRDDVAQASQSFVSNAPFTIITVLDIEKTNIDYYDWSQEWCRWIWYYEAGACSHNVLLGATARGLSGGIGKITDKDAICSILNLDRELYDPMLVVSVGK